MLKSQDLRLNEHSVKLKIYIYFIYFLNKDISLNNSLICLKFSIHAEEGQLEGSVSQNFYLGSSFNFIKSRIFFFFKWQKVARFLS